MEVAAYLRILAKYWWVVAVCILIGAGIGFGNAAFRTKEYQSVSTLMVSAIPGSTITEAYQNGVFSQDRANTYSALAASEQVAARAVNKLGLQTSADELRSHITSAVLPGTMMFTVAVTGADPGQAQTAATAVVDELVETIKELESRGTDQAVAGALVVNPPSYPTAAQGLGKLLRIIAGAAGGLVVGLLAAVLVGVLDRRVRGREEVEDVTGSFVLGALPKDRHRARRDVVDLDAGGTYVERLREMRTNLRFMALVEADPPVKVLAVSSPSAKAGRTTVAVDLAVALAESGRSVILVEGDLRHPVLADLLDVDLDLHSRGVADVLAGDCSFDDAVISGLPVGGWAIDCLLAGTVSESPSQLWSADGAVSLVSLLHERYDYAVIDSPALDDYNDGVDIGVVADGTLLLARMHVSSSTSLQRAMRTLRSANAHVVGAVITGERTRWGSYVGPESTEHHDESDVTEAAPMPQPEMSATSGRHHADPDRP